jgi:large repetitive protein
VPTPPVTTFTVSGGGLVDATGLFTAGSTSGGPFTVTAKAGALTAVAQVFVGVTPDTTPPLVALVAPIANAKLGGPVLLQATASDDVGVVRVRFFVDSTLVGEVMAPPFELTANAVAWGSGPHLLTARANDAAGNATTSDGVPVIVDTSLPPDSTPPVVAITSPANGVKGGTNIGVSIAASDDVGVVKVTLELDGTQNQEWLQAPYAGQLTMTPGMHRLVATAVDAAGNLTRSAAIDFEVLPEGMQPPVTKPTQLDEIRGSSCGCSSGGGTELLGLLLMIGVFGRFGRRCSWLSRR